MPGNSGAGYRFEEDLSLETEKKLDEPKMYRVILHNDHYTTMDFVVEVLVKIFHMPAAQAAQVMMDVHKKGSAICGVYTLDIAVTKVNQVHQMARSAGISAEMFVRGSMMEINNELNNILMAAFQEAKSASTNTSPRSISCTRPCITTRAGRSYRGAGATSTT